MCRGHLALRNPINSRRWYDLVCLEEVSICIDAICRTGQCLGVWILTTTHITVDCIFIKRPVNFVDLHYKRLLLLHMVRPSFITKPYSSRGSVSTKGWEIKTIFCFDWYCSWSGAREIKTLNARKHTRMLILAYLFIIKCIEWRVKRIFITTLQTLYIHSWSLQRYTSPVYVNLQVRRTL